MSLPVGIDHGAVTEIYATQVVPLGQVRHDEIANRDYEFVLTVDHDNVTYAANKAVVQASTGQHEVTIDVSGGSASAGIHPRGTCVSVPTATYPYCWVQVTGFASYVAGSASIIDGDYLKPDASEDGDCDEATEGTDENIIGIAFGTTADNATGTMKLAIRR